MDGPLNIQDYEEFNACINPDEVTIVPETPKKLDQEDRQGDSDSETLSIRPEFKILLTHVSEYDSPMKEDENPINAVEKCLGFEKNSDRSALSIIHNVIQPNKAPTVQKKSRGKRSSSSKCGGGHAIKRPKTSGTTQLSDSLKEILAKKKTFSISTGSDQDIVKIQSEVTNLLTSLNESETCFSETENSNLMTSVDKPKTSCVEDSVGQEVDVIGTVIEIFQEPSLESENVKEMDEVEMERLIDKLVCSSYSEPIIVTSMDADSLSTFEGIIERMDSSQEEEDLFADDEGDLKSEESGKQLFPVFIKGATSKNQEAYIASQLSSKGSVRLPIRDLGDNEQMILDAGQKKYGQVECPECQCIYDPDDKTDVNNHLLYHNRNLTTLKHLGWKNERIVTYYPDGARVIQVVKGDHSLWWRRVREILSVVDHDLGFSVDGDAHSSCERQIFLYVHKKQLLGCLVAEDITAAYRMMDTVEALCSEETVPAACGILRIWTASNARRKGIATKLVDSLRENFLSHKTLELDEVAFSSPSLSGREFAAKYCSNPCFLVYQ